MTLHLRSFLPAALAVCCLLHGCAKAPEATQSISVIPAPAQVVMKRGAFVIEQGSTSVKYVNGTPGEPAAQYFVELLRRTGGPSLALAGMVEDIGDARGIVFQLQVREGV